MRSAEWVGTGVSVVCQGNRQTAAVCIPLTVNIQVRYNIITICVIFMLIICSNYLFRK